MTHEIKVPDVAEGVKEGTVISLSVAVGDKVEYDQTLLELETDKAVVAIPSPVAGTITEIRVAEGEQASVGSIIMLLETEGEAGEEPAEEPEAAAEDEPESAPEADKEPAEAEKVAASVEEADAVKEAKPRKPEPADKAAKDQEQLAVAADEVDLTSIRRDDRVAPAAPSVRRLARELGVDIHQVQGSGAGGRISAEDVRLFVRDTMQRVTGGGAPVIGEFAGMHAQRPLPDFSKWGAVERQPLSKIREVTADAMGYAWSTIPMVTQYDRAQITELEAYRKGHNKSLADDAKVTMTAILAKVCATALRVFPQFNSSLDLASKELVLKKYVHVGVAVDTPNGLLVPVLRDADKKGVETLAAELNELAAKTRERKVSPAELDGGSFTISNLGGIGGTAFTPIVYAPQVAILGVSRAELLPVWNGAEFVPQLVMPLSLSYDHRVIDGADGARFLRWICEAIEEPLELVMKG